MTVPRYFFKFMPTFLIFTLLFSLNGCRYDVVEIKGSASTFSVVFAYVDRDGKAPNAGIVLTSLGAVVIDPPLSPVFGTRLRVETAKRSQVFWDQLFRFRKDRPQTQAPPVLYVFNTTYRGTHTFGNQAFLSSADVIISDRAGRRMADSLAQRAMREHLQSRFTIDGLDQQVFTPPTSLIEGKYTLLTPEVEVQFLTMGDCVGEGDSVVWLPKQSVLFAGDLVIPGFIPYHEGRTATFTNWIKALERLKQLQPQTVVPGHGPVDARVRGVELIDRQLRFLNALHAAVKQAVDNGRTLEQAMSEVRLAEFADWYGYQEWLAGNVKLVYEELTRTVTGSTQSSFGVVPPLTVEKADGYRGD